MTGQRVIGSKQHHSPRARLTARIAAGVRPATPKSVHTIAQWAIVGLVILGVTSSDKRLEPARSAPSPPAPAVNPGSQSPDLDYPTGGGRQLHYGETEVVRRALPLTSRVSSSLQDTITDAIPARDAAYGINQMVQKDDTLDTFLKPADRRAQSVQTGSVRQASPSIVRAADQGGWTDAGKCFGVTPLPIGTGNFIWPTGVHQMTGNRYSPWHRAIDLFGSLGDPVYAADAGVVIWAGPDSRGYGRVVMLDHGNGWQTRYAHLSQVHVRCGQQILQGALIGAVGSTGRSTAPHLHFEMHHEGDLPDPCLVYAGAEPACLPVPTNSGTGAPAGSWLGRYYDNMFLEGDPSLVRSDPAIDFDWGNGSPSRSSIPKMLWSASWTRTVAFAAGVFRFHAVVDDGIRVFIDDQVVLDRWQDAAGLEYASDKALAAGNHTVRVEYYQKGHQARIHFWWEKLP